MALSGWDALALPLSQCGKIGGETYRREENALTDILGFTLSTSGGFRPSLIGSHWSSWFSLQSMTCYPCPSVPGIQRPAELPRLTH